MITLATTLTLAAYLAQQAPFPLYRRVTICCRGVFTKTTALEKARMMTAGREERVKIIYLTNDAADFQRIGASHMSYEQLRERLQAARRPHKRLAVFLETPDGTAMEYWSMDDGVYERVVTRGRNPFRLSDSTDLLGLFAEGSWIHAHAASRSFHDATNDSSILGCLASWFPGLRVVLTIGESPTFHEALFDLPVTPALAWAWPPEAEPLVRRIETGR